MKIFVAIIVIMIAFSEKVIGQELYKGNLAELKKQAPSEKRDSAVVHNIFAMTKIITPQMNFWIDSLKLFSTKNNSSIGLLLWKIMDSEKVIRTLNFEEGVKKHLVFAKQLEEKNCKIYASWSYLRAGMIFARPSSGLLNKKDALLYYNKALEITIQAKDTNEIARTYDYIGEYYLDINDYKNAILYLHKAESLIEKYPNKYLFPTILASLGSCYLLLENNKKASFYYKKMDFWLNKSGLTFIEFYQSYIMNIYYLGYANYYIKKHEYKKAIEFAEQGFVSIKFDKVKNKRSYDTYALDHLKILYEANAQIKNYPEAFQYFQKYHEIQNSHLSSELNQQFQELNKKYQTEQKQIQITKLENEKIKTDNNSQRVIRYFLISVSILLSIGFGFAFWSNRKIKAQNKEITQAMLKGQTTERQRVAADLHDNLGSTLSSLRWSMQAIDKRKLADDEQEVYSNLQELIEKAYNDVRLLSHNLLPEEFEKQGLTTILQGFVRKMNKNSTIKFDLKIDENFGRVNNKIEFELYSICLELVNNIIKHSKASEAIICLSKKTPPSGAGGLIELIVSDNGIGVFKNDSDGKGMKNVKARVESLNGVWELQSIDSQGVSNKILIPV